MKVTVGYGKETKIDLEIADEQLIGVFNPNSVAKIDYNKAIDEALAQPLGRSTFDDFIDTKERAIALEVRGFNSKEKKSFLNVFHANAASRPIYWILLIATVASVVWKLVMMFA